MAALAPEQDWTWIRKIERRLRTTARSVRNKRIRLVSSEQLLSLGLELMTGAESDAGGTPLQWAVRYRDGLMISLLAARPLRRRNFCSIEVGRHLLCEGGTYWLRFGADETETRSRIERQFRRSLQRSWNATSPISDPFWRSVRVGGTGVTARRADKLAHCGFQRMALR